MRRPATGAGFLCVPRMVGTTWGDSFAAAMVCVGGGDIGVVGGSTGTQFVGVAVVASVQNPAVLVGVRVGAWWWGGLG